jgi:hypothetical protein
MGADGDSTGKRQLYGPAHSIDIARMGATRDVGATDKWENSGVGRHALPHVTVEINHQHTSSFR